MARRLNTRSSDAAQRHRRVKAAQKFRTGAAENASGDANTKWSKRRWFITIAAIIVGALVVVLAVNLTKEPTDHTNMSTLTVGGAVNAGSEYNDATMGSCLSWDLAPDKQTITNFQKVNCSREHRFEVAGVIDLNRYPSTRFGKGAKPLSADQVQSIRIGLCLPLVDSYLPNGLDPSGRFRVGLLQPGISAWNNGARTILCGIEANTDAGASPRFSGLVSQQVQALSFSPGTCIGFTKDPRIPGGEVPCSGDHALEVVGSFELSDKFKDFPSPRAQASYAEERCVTLSEKYMGNPDNLRNSTLTPIWSRVSLAGWNAGTRTVTCYLSKSSRKGFATLRGSARGPFTIDGQKPKKQPPLPPKNNKKLPDMHNDPLLNNSVPSGF